ncbi:hypothetical protein CEXT_219681 [Caerostris extrusa]|uniref:Uncharacterized protein n=1 Tax=Caerostris extrusa TaxID=172846 RepID=A0AAV4UCH0_CAEEX|nr:hypothetical protein CEXT_219681 [Caerostris extrusa]
MTKSIKAPASASFVVSGSPVRARELRAMDTTRPCSALSSASAADKTIPEINSSRRPSGSYTSRTTYRLNGKKNVKNLPQHSSSFSYCPRRMERTSSF